MSFRHELQKTSYRRKNRELVIRILYGFGLFVIICAVVVFLFYIPAFRITNISISGLDDKNAEELRAQIFSLIEGRKYLVVPKDHIVFFDQDKIKEFLGEKYRVRDYIIEENLPSELNIAITERKTWAVWCKIEESNKCLLIDENGLAFEKSSGLSGSVVLKILDERGDDFFGKNILEESSFSKIKKLIEDLPKYIKEEIKTVGIKSSGETYRLFLKDGIYLIIDSDTDAEKSIDNLLIALKSEEIKQKRDTLEYIDLRFSDKVFYKFK